MTEASSEAPMDARATRRRRMKVLALVLLAAFVAGGGWWLATRDLETTDDAFVEGEIVQVSPQVGGRVASVHFSDYDQVRAGDLLVRIDPRDLQAARDAAAAALDAARARKAAAVAALDLIRVTSGADFTRAEGALKAAQDQAGQARATAEAARSEASRAASDVVRYRELFQGGNASRQRLELAEAETRTNAARAQAAERAIAAADAQVAQAVAQVRAAGTAAQQVAEKEAQLALAAAQADQAAADLAVADLNLSYTAVTAPQSGRVSRKAVAAGDSVQKGQTVTRLIPGPPWVVANFKESQLRRMRPGLPVSIRVDAYPGLRLSGRIDSIQPGTGARFSLLPPENATGNFVKVVQRVPVKIVLDHPEQAPFLALGMSVVPEVDVGAEPRK